jgi:hypothetical protein
VEPQKFTRQGQQKHAFGRNVVPEYQWHTLTHILCCECCRKFDEENMSLNIVTYFTRNEMRREKKENDAAVQDCIMLSVCRVSTNREKIIW